jgi:hypothetical protein
VIIAEVLEQVGLPEEAAVPVPIAGQLSMEGV